MCMTLKMEIETKMKLNSIWKAYERDGSKSNNGRVN